MTRDTCRYPTCDEPTRDRGDTYGDDDQYTVSAFGARFCSTRCELKYEHVRADAQDARRADRDRGYRDEPHPEEVRR